MVERHGEVITERVVITERSSRKGHYGKVITERSSRRDHHGEVITERVNSRSMKGNVEVEVKGPLEPRVVRAPGVVFNSQ